MNILFSKLVEIEWRVRAARAASRRERAGKPRYRLRGRQVDVSQPISFGPREIMLTFDDGPAADVTRSVLRTLDHYDVSAMFFLVGRRIKASPRTPGEIRSRGHLVGSHTMQHLDLSTKPLTVARKDVLDGYALLASVLPDAPRFFRFPYLHSSPELDAMVEAEGFRFFGIDLMVEDWLSRTAKETVDRCLSVFDANGSGILLLHDIHRTTADALPNILEALGERGYSVVTPVIGTTPAA